MIQHGPSLAAYSFRAASFADHIFRAAIVSAPLWDSKTSTFAGLLTVSDYLNVIQYYWQNPEQLHLIDQFRLNSLRGSSQYLWKMNWPGR